MTATTTPPGTSSPYAELKAPTTARRLLTAPTTGPLVALLLACAFFALSTDQFLTGGNFSLIVQQVMVVGTLAIGQTLIILTAGIDLSCGAVMAFGSIMIAKMAAEGSLPPLAAIALGLVVCGGFGLLNGLLVQKIPLPPFIVTLGMLNVAFALTHIYSEEQTVTNLPGPLTALGQTFPLGNTDITYGSLVTIALFLLLAYALSSTGWGKHVYALGNSPEAARLNGIRTSRLTIGVYTVGKPPLRHRRRAAHLPHRSRRPAGRADRQPRQHHRRGPRRHQPLRRPRVGPGHLHRRPHRRCLPQRPAADGGRLHLPDPDHRCPGDPRGDRRPALPEEGPMTATSSPTPVLQARGLVKRYGQVTAIDGADFDLLPGEVLAVIGDNGAGKTSLIKALTGAVTPDEGEIRLNGRPITFSGPQSARAHGIETVYQDLAVAASMDIASNMFLGRELRRSGVLGSVFRMLDKKRMREEAAEHMADLKIGLRSLTQSVETLSGGQRQAVAVARSVAWARSVVVMDEPTAALGVKESGQVLDLIRRVRDKGMPVVLISHNMPHVFEIADRIHVHRLGRRAAVIKPSDYSMAEVVAIMTGALTVDAAGDTVVADSAAAKAAGVQAN